MGLHQQTQAKFQSFKCVTLDFIMQSLRILKFKVTYSNAKSLLFQVNACAQIDNEPLPDPMLTQT